MVDDINYKFVICGVSGVGKTYIERHFFHNMSFNEIEKQRIGPSTKVFTFSARPFKLGHMTINAIDTGGQKVLRKKLHGDMRDLCWIGTDACVYVIDFASDIVGYEFKKGTGINSDNIIWNRIHEIKEDLKNVIRTLMEVTPITTKVKLIILFHKWDLLNKLPNDIKKQWKNWMIEQLKNIEVEENFDFFTNNNGSKIHFLGFHETSILDNSCKNAIRKLIPPQTQLRKILNFLVENCKYLSANQVYATVLNEDGLEIESIQYPYLQDTEVFYDSIIRYFLPTLKLKQRFNSNGILDICQLKNPDVLFVVQPLSEEITLALVTDITEIDKIKGLLEKMDETLSIMDNLINIYYN
ncbi:MAG: hypothetical protein ACTSR3_16905 [Candidatus Helarchaeota archaeon]